VLQERYIAKRHQDGRRVFRHDQKLWIIRGTDVQCLSAQSHEVRKLGFGARRKKWFEFTRAAALGQFRQSV
jgi:hypothetical protein